MMEEDAARRIESKLETIIRLLAAPLVEGKTLVQSAELLAQRGLDNSQIAAICNTTPDAVRASRSTARRRAKSKEPPPRSKPAQARGIAP